MGSIRAKFEAFGWDVLDVKKGNDIEAIIAGLAEAKSRTGKGKPVCILLHTEMGNGIDFMMHTHAWHGKAPNDEQLAIALAQNPRGTIKVNIEVLKRVLERDNSSVEAIQDRMSKQWSDNRKIPLADYHIENMEWDDTVLKIDAIHQKLIQTSLSKGN